MIHGLDLEDVSRPPLARLNSSGRKRWQRLQPYAVPGNATWKPS